MGSQEVVCGPRESARTTEESKPRRQRCQHPLSQALQLEGSRGWGAQAVISTLQVGEGNEAEPSCDHLEDSFYTEGGGSHDEF